GQGTVYNEIEAIEEAVNRGAEVLNISLGFGRYTEAEAEACQKAVDAGVIICASSGNDGNSSFEYPASNPGVISVGSVKKSGDKSSFSQYNSAVDVVAPGESYYGLSSYGGYLECRGTSFSCPQVAAFAAMCKSINPSINHDEFMKLLGETCTDVGDPGRDDKYGYGIVNFGEAYTKLVERNQNSIRNASISGVTDKTYTSSEITQDIIVTMPNKTVLEEGKDYTVSYRNNVNVGRADMILEASSGSKYTGKTTLHFNICGTFEQAGISENAISLDEKTYYYTGNPIIPDVIIKDYLGRMLIEGVDYTISCDSNIEIGTAKINIIGIGLYSGELSKSFKIEKKPTSSGGGSSGGSSVNNNKKEEKAATAEPDPVIPIDETEVIVAPKIQIKKLSIGKKSFTLSWNKKESQGYQIQYSTSSKFTKGNKTKTKTIKKAGTTKCTVKNLKSKKKYYVRLRSYVLNESKRTYSVWSKVKTIKTK
ncbi:MAG: S8 family serine peptidase, partial [Bacillota bacterium]|nr:S8 family serine peptidase [Bacillota bacterium]